MNCIRSREYDGSHIVFHGINPGIKLRPHQLGAIAHVLYGGNTLLAHEVGAGKTFEMIASAMESKYLGLCSKAIMVVPNHLTQQTAAEFLRLYPPPTSWSRPNGTLKPPGARSSAPESLPATGTRLSSGAVSLRRFLSAMSGKSRSSTAKSVTSLSLSAKSGPVKANGSRSSRWRK